MKSHDNYARGDVGVQLLFLLASSQTLCGPSRIKRLNCQLSISIGFLFSPGACPGTALWPPLLGRRLRLPLAHPPTVASQLWPLAGV